MRQLLVAMALVLAYPCALSGAERTGQAAKPNIVIILADDLGYGDLSCYGHPTFKTPRIDRLADGAVRFTDFYAPCPFCAPSRASLMTGRFPVRCGVTGNPNPENPRTDKMGLPLGEITLAELLRDAGYATAMLGKWHLGHQPQFLPTRRGFQSYFGIPYSNDMRPVKLFENEKVCEYPVVQATLTRRYTDRAVDFIARNKDHSFFLYFAHAMPHKPLACSEQYYTQTGAGLYGDVLAELDESVGRVLDALQEHGIAGRTLVVFTSDNGAWYGGSTGGLRGMKGMSWEGGFRVPCIIRWPGTHPADRICSAPAVLMDIFATSLAAAGVAPPADRVIDGRDLLPVASGAAKQAHDAVFSIHAGRVATIRQGKWKLLARPQRERHRPADWKDPRAPDGVTILAPFEQYGPDDYPGVRVDGEVAPWMLFDLQQDPQERTNAADDNPQLVDELRTLLKTYEADALTSPTS